MYDLFKRIKPMLILMFLLLLIISSTVMVEPVFGSDQIVSNTLDSGAGSLRQAINDVSSGGTITFAAGLSGPITLESELPYIDKTVTIVGNGAGNTIIQASTCDPVEETCTHNYRIIQVWPSGNLTLDGVTVRHGKTSTSGGGIYNNGGTVHVLNSTISANKADTSGGAIINHGTLSIIGSNLTHNIASSGGAIANFVGLSITNSSLISNEATHGGGIYNSLYGIVTVTGTTFEDNSSNNGGGIRNYGIVTIANSTFSGNRAEYWGGAILTSVSGSSPGTLNITNVTIAGNTAFGGGGIGGGLYIGSDGTLNYTNTIIANSTAGGDCYKSTTGIIGDNLYNLVEDGSCDTGATGFLSGDPKLGDLDDNGGPTQTHALLPGSPAIDAGDPATCAADPVNGKDQRGVTRPQDGDGDGFAVCDIGAFEVIPNVAEFTGSPTSGLAPLQVDFTNLSTGDFDTCSWDFGNGGSSSDCDPPPYTYTSPGIYTVALTVSGPGGDDTQTRENYITVEESVPVGYDIYLPLLLR